MKESIRVALVQPKPYPAFDDPRNLGHALLMLERCRGEAVDVVCFPEYFPFQGERELAAAARNHKTYLVAGLVESEGGKVYNTATLFDRSGRILGRQRKYNIGLLEREGLGISPGDGVFRAFSTDFGKIGIPVCIDFWGQPEAGENNWPIRGWKLCSTSASSPYCAGIGRRAQQSGLSTIFLGGGSEHRRLQCPDRGETGSPHGERVSFFNLQSFWTRTISAAGYGVWIPRRDGVPLSSMNWNRYRSPGST